MNRIPRIAAALALSATLLSAAVPAAQARTFAQPHVPSVAGSWLDAALTWLGALGTSPTARTHQAPVVKSDDPIVPIVPALVPGLMHPMCGSVIDPSGHCGGGGTGG
jgi:hypothetical protein